MALVIFPSSTALGVKQDHGSTLTWSIYKYNRPFSYTKHNIWNQCASKRGEELKNKDCLQYIQPKDQTSRSQYRLDITRLIMIRI